MPSRSTRRIYRIPDRAYRATLDRLYRDAGARATATATAAAAS